jgi:hypothetical protein
VTFPERVNQSGNVVPAFTVDDEFAEEVGRHKWTLHKSGTGAGYIATEIDGSVVYLHRFVWRLRHGDCCMEIDHIDRNTTDNRLGNLRQADRSLQTLNRRVVRKRSSLPQGVFVQVKGGARPFAARITVGGCKRFLGNFGTPVEASEAYERARSEALARKSQELAGKP